MDALLNFGHWLQNTSWALSIATSDWAYPFVQLIHFSGLSLWVGTILAVDFRLLGIGKDQQTPYQISESVFVWNWIGLGVAVCGGFMVFACSAETYLHNPAFLTKVGILVPVGIIWHVVVQQKVRRLNAGAEVPKGVKIAGLVELLLWVSVATAAVLIPSFA